MDRRTDDCPNCGEAPDECRCCPACNGEGSWLPVGACGGCEFCPSATPCRECRGTGKTEHQGQAKRGEGT